MNLTERVRQFEAKLVAAVNESGLHPTILRLELLNLMHLLEDQERALAEKEETHGENSDPA